MSASGTASSGLRRGMRLSELLTVSDETDENGRLLLEDSAPKQARKKAVRAGITMKSVPCTYNDTPSRDGGLMNAAAYEALRGDTGDILDGFAWLTRNYLAMPNLAPGTLQGLVDVSNLGVSLPLVLFRHGTHPVPAYRSLPSYVASIFKASRGVFSAAVDMLNRQGPPSRVTNGAEVVAFADQNGHLIRPQTHRACAAPTRLITRTLDVILTAENADAGQSRLGNLVPFETLWEFYCMEHGFSQAFNRYSSVMNHLRESTDAADWHDLFGRTFVEDGRRWSFGDFTEAFLDYANTVQANLNRLLGRASDAPALTFDDLLRIL